MTHDTSPFDAQYGASGSPGASNPTVGDTPNADDRSGLPDDRPELIAGAALAGGFLLAQVIKWLGPDRDD